MTQDKKPGFWGRLFGEKPQPKSDTEEALERATQEARGEEEALAALRAERAAQAAEPEPTPAPAPEDEDSRDAAPPEMQRCILPPKRSRTFSKISLSKPLSIRMAPRCVSFFSC